MRHAAALPVALMLSATAAFAQDKEKLYLDPINTEIPHVSTDKSIKYDYDIVYVRAGRAGDKVHKRYYTDFSQPVTMEPGADLMLLKPDGNEELLVKGGEGSITDPVISFDGQWCYYTHIYDLSNRNQWTPPKRGADIFKINLKSKKIVRLTNQQFDPNTGAGNWTASHRSEPNAQGKNHFDYGVFNMGPCPVPGGPRGKLAFTTNREGYRPSKGYPAVALQLFVMDDRDESIGENETPPNLEKIGHLNIAGALHPVMLRDGRIMFSTLESQGIRSEISWGIWTIHPDGTNWNPLVSAFDPGGASNGFHFQTQLTDGSIIIEQYYNQNNSGFGAYIKLPAPEKAPYPSFAPGYRHDPTNPSLRFGRFDNGRGKYYRMGFMPMGAEAFTPFADNGEGPADRAVRGDKNTPAVGKVTHPSGAPDNALLTVYSPGPVNHQYTYLPQLDGGIYIAKGGETIHEPSQLRLIKNDPNYNESWPRAVVPYKRIYGIDEPKNLGRLVNDGKKSPHLPEGTPFALVGSSSLYKRESYPDGAVLPGTVTAGYAPRAKGQSDDPWKGMGAFTSHGYGMPINWHNQGAEAAIYSNDEVHAIRILAMEPTTDRKGGQRSGRQFFNHASERLRILGEIPVRKFIEKEGAEGQRNQVTKGQDSGLKVQDSRLKTQDSGLKTQDSRLAAQPLDPDNNPDTSFLAKIPADVVFTFQTIDKHGMVLNMSQTWHQLRAGEVRTDCGGCHAHSQRPTDFNLTLASKSDYKVWDLTKQTPLITTKDKDESKQKWDVKDESGVRYAKSTAVTVEYFRDIQPILQKSCVACHTKDAGDKVAGNLVLDGDDEWISIENSGKFPGTFVRLAMDERAKFGHKPPTYDSWGYPNASRYIRKLQARRSLLTWKIFGQRLDGFSNDDHPSPPEPGARSLVHRGQTTDKNKAYYDLDFVGSQMPPKSAVEGTYKDASGKMIKVEPLTDEDRRTIARWIDLGCPIDLDGARANVAATEAKPKPADAKPQPAKPYGWFCDDQRPTLSLTYPQPGENAELSKIVIGIYDYGGLDEASLSVTASVALNGVNPGDNLATKFQRTGDGVYELKLSETLRNKSGERIVVSIKDKQGNTTRIERTFSVVSKTAAK